METITMKDIPAAERPYEKCLQYGAASLTDAELLSIIIRTGRKGENSLDLANNILALNYPGEGILGLLHLSLPELMNVKGIGQVKGTQLLCIGELSRRIWKRAAVNDTVCYDHPRAIVNYYIEDMRHMEQEQLKIMLLNTKNMLIKDVLISKGTVNASIATPREILIEALRYHAVKMIMVHNHPSGDPAPSQDDLRLTKRVYEAAELVGIELLDHIVIGDNSYISFKEKGML
ncbi:DNA repair protein RadC [Clostridium sp. MCC353]|uniref:RadC family protein n=1 Tax=Clostridium sp. MCC353 TaxID=2592646 RepID=UPI001C0345C0|nr:DNA repair protein RadC [Clostridium sp. MCC353]MBT9776992.1 DNA repair protein RadC [Clostridium sp. MCC353]